MVSDRGMPARRVKDAGGHSWRIGTSADVAWIVEGTSVGLAITSAIPPVFAAYATVVLPDGEPGTGRHHRALLDLLTGQSPGQRWWLGYLDTGASDVVWHGAPTVKLYAGWDYVLIEAGPRQAATWRGAGAEALRSRTPLPDLMFPADRSWLSSTLWDDDWTCIGGPADLVSAIVAHPDLRATQVRLGEDATPPGHVAF